MSRITRLKDALVHNRRTRFLAGTAARLLPRNLRVLDIGCGDGLFGSILLGLRPDLRLMGAEIAPRAGCLLPAVGFDGERLPFEDGSFGATLLVDVLHHAASPPVLLREAARVSSGPVLLKDHHRTGFAAQVTLSFMDLVGNWRHPMAMPFRYFSPAEWDRLFGECGLELGESDPLRGLYPFPAAPVFGRRLHFMALLQRTGT